MTSGQFPPVRHKLPELFNLIILADENLRIQREFPILSFEHMAENIKNRRRYTKAAEEFISKQKRGSK